MATLYCFTPGGKIRKMINDSANPRPPYATRFQREREIVCIIYVLIATNLAGRVSSAGVNANKIEGLRHLLLLVLAARTCYRERDAGGGGTSFRDHAHARRCRFFVCYLNSNTTSLRSHGMLASPEDAREFLGLRYGMWKSDQRDVPAGLMAKNGCLQRAESDSGVRCDKQISKSEIHQRLGRSWFPESPTTVRDVVWGVFVGTGEIVKVTGVAYHNPQTILTTQRRVLQGR